MKKFLKVFLVLIIAGGAAFFLMYRHIAIYPQQAKPEKSDVILVLGCQIWGRDPSWSLEYRLQTALTLYKEGYGKYILVSGGQGRDEETAESAVMKDWLVKKGVEGNAVIEENRSTSTYENLKFSKEIMEQNAFTSAVIVSNDFHLYRSVMIAEKLGIKATGAPAPSVPHLKSYYLAREVLSVVKTLLFDF